MLCAQDKSHVVTFEQRLNASNISEWWMDRDVDRVEVILTHKVCQLLNALNRFIVIQIHLPVPTDNGLSLVI
jgi:hypothetical protein